jgi:predicted transcriptional regulator of viral defense system
MKLANRLMDKYSYDSPIFISDIEDWPLSYENIRQTLSRLVKNGTLERFSQGVYYFPKETELGKTLLDARKVYERRYISSNDEVFGFYAGMALKNQIGFTSQVPNVIEIVTNNESSRMREIMVGRQKVRLRKSTKAITRDNVAALQLLDFLNREDIDWRISENRSQLRSYIRQRKISRGEIMSSLEAYPAKVSRKLLESGAYDELT